MNRKLYRSEKDKAICGVCAGFGRYFGVDPIVVRLVFVLAFLTYGVGLMFYLACALVIPKEPEDALWAGSQGSNEYEEASYVSYEEDKDRPATRYDGAGGETRRDYYSAESGPSEKDQASGGSKGGVSRENVGTVLVIIGGYLLIRIILPWLSNKLLLGLLAIGAGVYILKSGKK